MPTIARAALLTVFSASALTCAHATSKVQCEARSGAKPPAVVELFTSEGCSSCPPADRWLSTLNGQPELLPLAFHVNYWDRLGWQDRFATPANTARQHQIRKVQNGQYVYTPQVVLNGQDHRGWYRQSPGQVTNAARAALVTAPTLQLNRDGNRVIATVGPSADAASFAGYWAVLQDGLTSKVTRGENAGETLTHDHVVSLYQPVAAWSPRLAQQWQLSLPEGPQFDALRVAFIVTLPDLVHPVQAVVLSCKG